MTITELIAELEKLKSEHGDLRVTYDGRDGELTDVRPHKYTREGWGFDANLEQTHSIEEIICL